MRVAVILALSIIAAAWLTLFATDEAINRPPVRHATLCTISKITT